MSPTDEPTRKHFIELYDSTPPWDIGRPQSDLAAAFDELELRGSAIDLGCGTGEHVLALVRRRGVEAWGIDSTPAAIAAARAKARERGIERAQFIEGDALAVDALGRLFDTVIDCGLFHVLSETERRRYIEQLGRVVPRGGLHLMLGFASNSSGFGPRGYSPEELRAYFGVGWIERFIRPAGYETNATKPDGQPAPKLPDGRMAMPAWLSCFERS
jgi:cyclopropane fatty-acyl-phospholipid synthase-like methyltransferase